MGEKIDRQHIFKEYFESGTGYDFAKSQALCGTLQHSPLRSLCWRVFLGLLPGNDTSSWVKLLEAQRREYSELVKHYSVDPYQAEKEGDLAIFNPLSQDEDSPWQTFFHNKELKEVILQDIHRTYQEKEFFQSQKAKDQMLQILFIYVKENSTSNIGYRQGMHELLAPVLYLLHNQSIPVDQLDGHISSVINSEEYVEHDAFIIFRKMMSVCEKWYLTSDPSRSETVVDPLSVKTSLTSSSNGDLNSSSPIIMKCKYIQGKLLREVDPTLASYLDDMSIEPQIYILRWVRLLFGREFHLDDVLVVWDAIFAFGGDFDLIDHLCLAMLQYIRDQLLSSDNNGCLKRLFNYPPVEDVTLIILKALSFADPKLKIKSKKLTPPVKPLPPPPEKESAPSIALRNFVDTLLDDPQIINNKAKARLAEKLKKSQETRVHMSSRLERIVYILQSSVLSPDEVSKDDLIGVIAELKQVKDILNGSIEDSSMHPNALFHQFK